LKEISARGGRRESLFLTIVNVLRHPKEVGHLLSISSIGKIWMFFGITYFNIF
jgi:hypothetical protein